MSRSALRYQSRLPDDESRLPDDEARLPGDEPRLLSRMEVLVRKHPRKGYRVPKQQHTHHRLGAGGNACHRHRPEHRNHIWALDFIFDRDETGRSLRWLTVVDEYTRECPKLLCEPSITAQDVIDELIAEGHPHLAPEGRSRHPLRGTGGSL